MRTCYVCAHHARPVEGKVPLCALCKRMIEKTPKIGDDNDRRSVRSKPDLVIDNLTYYPV